jgi:hypothetical protein
MQTRLVFPLLAAALIWSVPAAAEWKEYVLREAAVALQLPAAPKKEASLYKTEVIGAAGAPTVIYTAEDGDIRFKLTVADLRAPHLFAKGANIMAECYFLAEQEGEVRANLPLRAEDGTPHGVRGRWVSVDLRDMQGNKQTGCLFAQGRLIRAEALIPRSHPQAETPVVAYFMDSLRILAR